MEIFGKISCGTASVVSGREIHLKVVKCPTAPGMAKFIDCNFPISRLIFLVDMQRWEGGMINRILNYASRLEGRRKVPSCVLMSQPSISLIWAQLPSPYSTFFTLIESLTSNGREIKISFRARKVSSDARYCCSKSPWVAQFQSSI